MKIFVISHKFVELPTDDNIYKMLIVGKGKEDSRNEKFYHDDDGINISFKNESYCELTGLYWIWKNVNEDIVGLCHYRRFLSKKILSNSSKYFLNKEDIEKDLIKKDFDIILPKERFYKGKIVSETSTAPNLSDMKYVRDVLAKKYPDYLKCYDNFLNKNKCRMCNVMICKKSVFDEYCQWLFDILFETEQIIPKDNYINDQYRKRLFGFISERLLNVWVEKNELKVKEYNLVNLEENIFKKIINLTKSNINKNIHK